MFSATRTTKSACIFALFASICAGQSNLASISGVVSDPSGSVIPQAIVTATDTQTGQAGADSLSAATGDLVGH